MVFDAVIMGSGLGGLQCAYILGKEGYNVCVLEKNPVLGGCLQTFRRGNTVFDTGMHYIGSMDEGQILHTFFSYFGLSERLRLKRMDEDGYDAVWLGDKEYLFPMGIEKLHDKLHGYFPGEKDALDKYTSKLVEVSRTYQFDASPDSRKAYMHHLNTGFDDWLSSITSNPTLRKVIHGLSPLYAGVKEKTPLYIPMIIHSSYNNSAYRFIDGGSQISNLLEKSILNTGGTILRNAEVTGISFRNGSVESVTINNRDKVEGKNFISNIHPKKFLEIGGDAPFRPAYRNRINSIDDSAGMFTLYLSMKENEFPYMNRNYYIYRNDDVWGNMSANDESWPQSYMMHISPSPLNDKYADAITINSFMKWNDLAEWEDTTVGKRGDSYTAFKKEKAGKMLSLVESDFPGIRGKINGMYTSTPLTYRDYTGTWNGSVYGILKDFRDPLSTMIMPRTSIPNLFFTGQNINIHGVVGVTVCSVLTCMELTGSAGLLDKIRRS